MINVDSHRFGERLAYIKYVPISSFDVQKSILVYKNTLPPNILSINDSNLTKYLVLNSFFFNLYKIRYVYIFLIFLYILKLNQIHFALSVWKLL